MLKKKERKKKLSIPWVPWHIIKNRFVAGCGASNCRSSQMILSETQYFYVKWIETSRWKIVERLNFRSPRWILIDFFLQAWRNENSSKFSRGRLKTVSTIGCHREMWESSTIAGVSQPKHGERCPNRFLAHLIFPPFSHVAQRTLPSILGSLNATECHNTTAEMHLKDSFVHDVYIFRSQWKRIFHQDINKFLISADGILCVPWFEGVEGLSGKH